MLLLPLLLSLDLSQWKETFELFTVLFKHTTKLYLALSKHLIGFI